MHLTTERWHPGDCNCTILNQYYEGENAPPADTEGNHIQYCSIEEATLIRLEKHEMFLAQYKKENDIKAIQGRMRWWNRQENYSESICSEHSSLRDGIQRYYILRDESSRHQIVLNIISNFYPGIGIEETGITAIWRGTDSNRVLEVHTPNDLDIEDLKEAVRIQFGPNKVNFV